jgi:F-type H+-transporting ATPase subunit b
MNGVKKITALLSLFSLTLWLALSFGTAFASSDTGHAAAPAVHGTEMTNELADTLPHEKKVAFDSLAPEKLKDLFWRILNFIVLMFILVKFGAKPLGSGLSSRRKKIVAEIEDLEKKRTEAQQSYSDFQAKLAGAETEIDKVVERAIAQAEVEKVKIIEKAEQAAADIKRSAEQAIQNEMAEARKTLKNDVADQAAVMAEELVVQNLTDADQVKIIENYLDKVGAVQ